MPYNAPVRAIVLVVVVAAALAILLMGRNAPAPATDDLPQLSYITTAHQLGVVGYRDPIGAISPDGTRFAFTEGRFIRVVPIGGGAVVTLPPGEGQIRYLTWKGPNEIVAEDATSSGRWWIYRPGDNDRTPLWDRSFAEQLRQVTFSADGTAAAALIVGKEGAELWRGNADGSDGQRTRLQGRAAFPAFRANGDVACIIDARLSLPCSGAPLGLNPEREVYGPIAFAADGATVYFASPNDGGLARPSRGAGGMVELWSADVASGAARRLSSFDRDAYAPSVASSGTTVFKVQSYRTTLADVALEGGPTRQLTTFQSETPSYHPTRPLISFTFGTWRRIVDDAKYPDIAQEIGVVDVSQPLPASKPTDVLEESDSEDQAMSWSPNGKWIAFHSHKEMSDDVWLRPANGSQPDQRITMLGRGAEVGWPRWSPDGRTVLLNGARRRDGASVLYAIGVNQDSGAVTSDLREIAVTGISGEMGHAEWLPDSTTIVATVKEGPGRHAIFTVPVSGGAATVVHRFDTEHDFSGLGVSPNGRFVAFAAPGANGFYQIFLKAIGGATSAVQLTTDPSHKTQPTFSPDGARVAFTVWSYEAAFWSFGGR